MLYIKWLGHNNTLIRIRVYLLPPKDCCATATGYQMVRWKHARYITQWLPAPALACPMGLFWNTAASLAEAHPLTAKITKVRKTQRKNERIAFPVSHWITARYSLTRFWKATSRLQLAFPAVWSPIYSLTRGRRPLVNLTI